MRTRSQLTLAVVVAVFSFAVATPVASDPIDGTGPFIRFDPDVDEVPVAVVFMNQPAPFEMDVPGVLTVIESMELRAVATDGESGMKSIALTAVSRVEGSTGRTTAGGCQFESSVSVSRLPPGPWRLVASAEDCAGNPQIESANVTVV